MHLVLITSLDALSRNNAASVLADLSPGTPVVSGVRDIERDFAVTIAMTFAMTEGEN